MQAQKQRDLKYQASTLLNSSRDLGWSTMFAELRSHGPYEQPGTAGPHLEIALAVRGSDEELVATKFAGTLRRVRPTTGTIWLRPAEAAADHASHSTRNWLAFLAATIAETERRGGLTPPRGKQKPSFSLTRGQMNAVRAAFKAGITPARIARQFGLSKSDVRKALSTAP